MHTKELIARRPPERSELAGWYAEVFEAQRMEGLSVSDLAASIGVTSANLYYWRRRLRELGWEDDVVNDPADQDHAPRLVQVTVDSEERAASSDDQEERFEVHLSGSRSISVPPGFDVADLARIVRALESC